ncbi:putative RNA-directed DNA polymerase, eukaryota, reverse transcriptase zinc-binding domain protein [Tanacetum coccineum]
MSCLNSSFASVLINGSPTKEFKVERGLRQGDPLSPFLFILAIEALNVVMLEAKNKNIFKGIEVGNDKVYISHLQFADDALIMGEWSLHNAKVLTRIFTCFYLASGLKVNYNKSKLFGIGVTNLELNSIANSIGCQPSLLPCIYLGLPIGANMSRCETWVSTISPLLSPIGTINKLESIRRKFFWGDNMEENKIAWIAWDKVIAPLKKWRSWHWKIRNGRDTRFWLDTWIGNEPLKDSFPRLFRLESTPTAMVYARCPLDATVLHDSTANSLHHNSTGLSHLLGPFEFGPSGSGSTNNNFVQPPMLPRGLDFQWLWYRTPRSPIELQELS